MPESSWIIHEDVLGRRVSRHILRCSAVFFGPPLLETFFVKPRNSNINNLPRTLIFTCRNNGTWICINKSKREQYNDFHKSSATSTLFSVCRIWCAWGWGVNCSEWLDFFNYCKIRLKICKKIITYYNVTKVHRFFCLSLSIHI